MKLTILLWRVKKDIY